jgi:hypothetical protein
VQGDSVQEPLLKYWTREPVRPVDSLHEPVQQVGREGDARMGIDEIVKPVAVEN